MIIKQICSRRSYVKWPSAHLIYEWEEDFSTTFNAPIISSRFKDLLFDNKISRHISSKFPGLDLLLKLDTFRKKQGKTLMFEMVPKSHFSYATSINTIPLIIDFWNRDEPENFYRIYRNCEVVGISSLETYTFLKNNDCPLNIVHMPLSIPDKYRLNGNESFEKKYDIILAGRRNEVLWKYMHLFSQKYPETEFLFQEQIDGRLMYVSNKSGVIGEFQQREDYMTLLKACKVGFYATPGMDGAKDTGGFNPVTPRLLELIASGCHVICRYPDNEDTRFYNMVRISPSVGSYEEFESLLFKKLNGPGPSLKFYSEYLEDHYTSKRAALMKDILKKLQ